MAAGRRKCVVWDLDNTLWDGVCLEGDVRLRPEAPAVLETLDRRGILHSVASRGEEEVARRQLEAFGLDRWFLVPRINWLPKPANLERIAADLGLGTDALAFVDDDPFEREHMAFMRPEVLVLDAAGLAGLPDLLELTPDAITPEASRRRLLYREDEARRRAEAACPDRRAFLAGCGMVLTVRPPAAADVPRIRELMSRTHQLNTTGLLLDEDRIRALLAGAGRPDAPAAILVADFRDRFGSYGTVGVAIAETAGPRWRLTYLAMSCRVLGRGVETAFLHALLDRARRGGCERLEATLRETGRNGSMRALYQMAGLVPAGARAAVATTQLFRAPPSADRRPPTWVEVRCESC